MQTPLPMRQELSRLRATELDKIKRIMVPEAANKNQLYTGLSELMPRIGKSYWSQVGTGICHLKGPKVDHIPFLQGQLRLAIEDADQEHRSGLQDLADSIEWEVFELPSIEARRAAWAKLEGEEAQLSAVKEAGNGELVDEPPASQVLAARQASSLPAMNGLASGEMGALMSDVHGNQVAIKVATGSQLTVQYDQDGNMTLSTSKDPGPENNGQ